jgi:hypothetical protein
MQTNLALLRSGDSLEDTTELLRGDLEQVIEWGRDNMVLFAAEKYQLQHFASTGNKGNPTLTLSDGLVVRPSELARDNVDS